MIGRALLLVGSPRASGSSTSGALGTYLRERLESHGVTTPVHFVPRSGRQGLVEKLLVDLDRTDLLLLATPVYVDSLPWLVTHVLERIEAHRVGQESPRPIRFAGIVNCGLPEPDHCSTALRICRSFARHAGLDWAGGLALAGGDAVDGRQLDGLGWMARHVRAALELTAGALAEGRPIPEQAVEWMSRPLLPRRAYSPMTSLGWTVQRGRRGAPGAPEERTYA